MISRLELHPDRLLPADPTTRGIARELYASVQALPIISPHGHTDPQWWASDANFGNAAELLLHPDHYIFRMLYSQGVSLDALGIGNPAADPRESWRLFAGHYHLFRGTPSRMWLDWVFAEAFAKATKLAPTATGCAHVTMGEGRVTARRIELRADDPGMLENSLPRELAHVILADLFPSRFVDSELGAP